MSAGHPHPAGPQGQDAAQCARGTGHGCWRALGLSGWQGGLELPRATHRQPEKAHVLKAAERLILQWFLLLSHELGLPEYSQEGVQGAEGLLLAGAHCPAPDRPPRPGPEANLQTHSSDLGGHSSLPSVAGGR